MEKQKGLTQLGLATIICTVILILFIAYLAFQRVRSEACRMVCGVNLKGLGTAMTVYANDYNGSYPQLRGKGPWSKELGFAYDLAKPDFDGEQSNTLRTITACWYLLVREADVSPKSFVCPQSDQEEFLGRNSKNSDITELWDFGENPYQHVSYALHNPFSQYSANDKSKNEIFAVAADMSPWFDENGDIAAPGPQNESPQVLSFSNPETWSLGNSLNHKTAFGKNGQNILYVSGDMAFTQQPNVGVDNDNIYTFWSVEDNPTDQDRQGGTAPTGRSAENDAKSENDSFLAI